MRSRRGSTRRKPKRRTTRRTSRRTTTRRRSSSSYGSYVRLVSNPRNRQTILRARRRRATGSPGVTFVPVAPRPVAPRTPERLPVAMEVQPYEYSPMTPVLGARTFSERDSAYTSPFPEVRSMSRYFQDTGPMSLSELSFL